MMISLRSASAKYVAVLAAFAVFLAASAGGNAKAPEKTVLLPVSPWNLDGTDSGCTLKRAFGTAARPLVLQMRRFAPGDRFYLVVSGDEIRSVAGDPVRMQYGDLPPLPPEMPQVGLSERPGQRSARTVFLRSNLVAKTDAGNADFVTPEMENEARTISIRTSGRQLVLETGSLGKPFALMRQCTDALVASWGLDPKVQTTLSRKAQPLGQKVWAREIQAVYPRDLAAAGEQGRVNLRMLLDSKGKPIDCKVLASYNDPKFDKIACEKMLAVAVFEPALDAAGLPVASYYATMITWIISGV